MKRIEITNNRKRIIWIDYAKALGIYLVILGHTLDGGGIIKDVIYSFHMPLFFIISGFLYKYTCGKKFAQQTIRQLLIPLLFFNLLELLPRLRNITDEGILSVITNFIADYCKSFMDGEPLVGPSWFVLALIWMRIILYVFIRFLHEKSVPWLLMVSLLLGWGLSTYAGNLSENNILCLGNAIIGLPFYVGGYVIKTKYNAVLEMVKKRLWLITLIVFLLWGLGVGINGFVSLAGCHVGNNIWLMYLTGFAGTMSVVFVCNLPRKENKWVYVISCGTIVILCTHGFLLNNTINKYPIFELFSVQWYAYSILGCLLLLLIEIPIIRFFFRYLNWSVGGRRIVIKK